MKRSLAFLLSMTAAACSDDGGNPITPDTVLVEVPAAASNQGHIRITFAALGNANGFLCVLDGNTPAPCISPFEADAGDGAHTFEVAAALNANVDETPATHTWRIDTVLPETAVLEGPPALDNSLTPTFTFSGSDPAGARAIGDVTFECSLDDEPFAACLSPHQVTVTDGAHELSVRAKDDAGNVDDSPAAHAWTVDSTAPDTMITAGPAAGSTSGPSGSFAFSSNEPTATFECSFDSSPFTTCVSPAPFTLGDGLRTFSVRAKDEGGIVDPSPAIVAWTVDAIAPAVTISQGPANPTNDPTPTFTFAAAEPATFECQIDGVVTFTACTSPWNGPAVSDGNRTFRVRATDTAGNLGAESTFAWLVDTVAPDTAISGGPTGTVSDNDPAFSFTATPAGGTFECSLDGAAFAMCTAPQVFADLADGAHTFAVRACDAVPNCDATPAMRSWTIDTTPPDTMITMGPTGTVSNNDPSFSFVASPAGGTFQCSLDGAVPAACTSPRSFTNVADGLHTFEVFACDPVGNCDASPAAGSWTIDTTPPSTTIETGPTAGSTTNDNDPSFTFSASPAAGATFECRLGTSGSFTACTSPHALVDVADGAHTFAVRACDAVGNCDATPATRSWTIDTTPPATTIDTGPVAGSMTNDNDPSFTFSANPAAGATFECRLGTAGGFTACTSPHGFTNVADGAQTFAVRACDAVGNCDATPATRSWTIDTTPPATTIDTGPVAGSTTNDNDPSFTFSANPAAGATFECRLGTAGGFTACTSPHSFTNVADGAQTFAVRACDAATNCDATPATRSWTIDTTPPIVTITKEPPAKWPVNYADLEFSAPGASSFQCAINGGTFLPCSSPHTAGSGYATPQTFAVRAFDTIGNFSEDTATWTPVPGLVLHYPWEQGATTNTSLLAQVPALSPNGVGPLPGTNVLGGWAGTAIGNNLAAHKYLGTSRPLRSSADDTYTVSFWIRATTGAASTNLVSNHPATNTGGFRLSVVNGPLIRLEMFEQGTTFMQEVALTTNRWVNIGVRAKSGGMEVFFDGKFRFGVATPSSSGFGGLQASELTVGPSSRLELDDLRFYNQAYSDAEMCTLVARGIFNAQTGQCTSLSPGLELDFESGTLRTGTFQLALGAPQAPAQFVSTTTGRGVSFPDNPGAWGYLDGLKLLVQNLPGRAFSFWFQAGTAAGVLWDSTINCGLAVAVSCGIRLSYASNKLSVFANASNAQSGTTTTIDVQPGMNSVVVTERRSGGITVALSVFVNGLAPVVIPVNTGDIYAAGADGVKLVNAFSLVVDEYEFWGQNLDADPEMLCENGFDGEFDPVDGTCALTSN